MHQTSMNVKEFSLYCCPLCKNSLLVKIVSKKGSNIIEGELYDINGHKFPIIDGIPWLISNERMGSSDIETQKEFERRAETYDSDKKFFFKTFYEDEKKIRNAFADLLEIKPSSKVLEIGCGTGLDSENIIQRLGDEGKFYLADISVSMLKLCRAKIIQKNPSAHTEFALADGHYLPYPDESFDRTFHFGNIETFSQVGLFFKEATRVTKKGGIVVLGGESVPTWLRNTEYGKMLMSANSLFKKSVPEKYIPENARNVNIHRFLGELFYMIKFTVGDGIPPLNIDIEFPSARGGTYRTRYYATCTTP